MNGSSSGRKSITGHLGSSLLVEKREKERERKIVRKRGKYRPCKPGRGNYAILKVFNIAYTFYHFSQEKKRERERERKEEIKENNETREKHLLRNASTYIIRVYTHVYTYIRITGGKREGILWHLYSEAEIKFVP